MSAFRRFYRTLSPVYRIQLDDDKPWRVDTCGLTTPQNFTLGATLAGLPKKGSGADPYTSENSGVVSGLRSTKKSSVRLSVLLALLRSKSQQIVCISNTMAADNSCPGIEPIAIVGMGEPRR
jgi:hypothetical protein